MLGPSGRRWVEPPFALNAEVDVVGGTSGGLKSDDGPGDTFGTSYVHGALCGSGSPAPASSSRCHKRFHPKRGPYERRWVEPPTAFDAEVDVIRGTYAGLGSDDGAGDTFGSLCVRGAPRGSGSPAPPSSCHELIPHDQWPHLLYVEGAF